MGQGGGKRAPAGGLEEGGEVEEGARAPQGLWGWDNRHQRDAGWSWEAGGPGRGPLNFMGARRPLLGPWI